MISKHLRGKKYVIYRGNVLNLVFYTFIASIFVFPNFTPFSVVGPEGVLRLDQILIILILIILTTYNFSKIEFVYNLTTISLFGVVATIWISYIVGSFLFNHPSGAGEIFDLLIWTLYIPLLSLIPISLNQTSVRKSVFIIVWGSLFVSLIGLTQLFGIWSEVNILSNVLYGPGKFINNNRLDSIFTNPNTYGQFLLLPFFILLSILSQTNSLNNGKVTTKPWFVGITSLLVSINLYFTHSRTSFLALIIGISIFMLILIVQNEFVDLSNAIPISLALGAFSSITLLFLRTSQRYNFLLNPLQSDSLQIRFDLWKNTLPIIRQSILVGHGPSSAAILEAGVPTIDSGILGWVFHYGIIGGFLLMIFYLSIVRLSISIVMNEDTKHSEPTIWALGKGVLIYTLIVPILAITMPVPRYRRVFTLYLGATLLIMAYIINTKKNLDAQSKT